MDWTGYILEMWTHMYTHTRVCVVTQTYIINIYKYTYVHMYIYVYATNLKVGGLHRKTRMEREKENILIIL